MKKIVIFASGKGTNSEKIMDYFPSGGPIQVSLLISNNPQAGALQKARERNVRTMVLDKKESLSSGTTIQSLINEKTDLIVLAGFLWLIPEKLISAFPDKIINLHPALLPKYGGKGMFGVNVHKAVLEAKEKESGITIHYVNKNFDEGKIIFQAKCLVSPRETVQSLASKIHVLEHEHYPKIIEQLLSK